jgi:hypothetical protein
VSVVYGKQYLFTSACAWFTAYSSILSLVLSSVYCGQSTAVLHFQCRLLRFSKDPPLFSFSLPLSLLTCPFCLVYLVIHSFFIIPTVDYLHILPHSLLFYDTTFLTNHHCLIISPFLYLTCRSTNVLFFLNLDLLKYPRYILEYNPCFLETSV